MKILLCFGTRPEAIKMAPVIRELEQQGLDYKVCVTAQHREMLDQVIRFFKIKIDHDLDLMQHNQSLNSLSAGILLAFDGVLEMEKPDLVLVHGDTTTSVIAALASFNRKIIVGHIEAGLRTYNRSAPYPEEINRQLTSRLADLHFSPTKSAADNLVREGLDQKKIFITGNTIVDALQWAIAELKDSEDPEIQELKKKLSPGGRLILVTGHRRENFGQGIEEICQAILELANIKGVEIIFPVHPNPIVQENIKSLRGHPSIHLIEPTSYPAMLWLMQKSSLIISDSGGIQEEAPSLGKTVLVTREVSERMEGVVSGFSILTGSKRGLIIREAKKILGGSTPPKNVNNPYGDGTASKKIVTFLKDYLFQS